ncbi:hypothetical protein GARC_2985 [Paraglaciecola arctica BSs20135]|uniref:Uncharacterized protein n=1 Tax=Paraglaciecola arctica BSs20135 TaxID=493475 RepID=K6YTC1_9ALTE|nr:hypothetical protein GARC_2985 [Paraglaciecola arctica BSs20135]
MYKASSAFIRFIGNYQLKKCTEFQGYLMKKLDAAATRSK